VVPRVHVLVTIGGVLLVLGVVLLLVTPGYAYY
jgi:hypothetical protein